MEVETLKGEFWMPTKLLERDETLAANSLRSLSQKSLMEMVTNFEKLGVIVNNDISIAMLSWDRYEGLVDLIHEQNEIISNLESLVEDLQLAKQYGEDVVRVESGQSKTYEVDSASQVFNMIKK